MAAPTYRQASIADLAAAVRLRAAMDLELSGNDPDAQGDEWRRRFVEFYAPRIADDTAALFAAHDNDSTIAMAIVYKLVNHRSEIFAQPSAYLTSVYVSPLHRRRGIAAKLTRMAVDWARDHGCVVVRLRTSRMGRALYQKMGFSATDEMEVEFVSS
jgi:GNAT superfamily N-acetyltransferase